MRLQPDFQPGRSSSFFGRWGSFACAVLAGLSLAAACSNGASAPPPTPARADVSADLEPFLTSYFATWSRGDMEGYRDHFHPKAVIYLVKGGQVLSALSRDPFVDGQRASQEAGQPGVETMTSFRADEDRQGATVMAEWELINGDRTTVGIDRFTLIRDEEWHWKIISLTFYATGRGRLREGGASKGPRRSKKSH